MVNQIFMQAFDLGVPVIARRIPGNSYLVDHNETGLLYETPEVSQLYFHM